MATPQPPLRILSLDGGGIRGISSLLILEDIMEKIREALGLNHTPKPCEYFELIGGTGTGGIIAIMLGRLGMTIGECILAYRKVARQAFTPKPVLFGSMRGAFSATALEGAIKETTKKFCMDPECAARRGRSPSTAETCQHGEMPFRSKECTKTVVLAITKENVDAGPTLFTTYDTAARFDGCAIWQVARATSAAITFFKPISVGRDEVEFIDAGFGYNNPSEVLIEEARRQFPGDRQMRVLSIGTGLGAVVSIKTTRLSVLKALAHMATSSNTIAASLESRYSRTDQYWRFDVDQGLADVTLSDCAKASKIAAHTQEYLRAQERRIEMFVTDFVGTIQAGQSYGGRPQEMSSAELDTQEQVAGASAVEIGWSGSNNGAKACYHIPLPKNKNFIGRKSVLGQLEEILFIQINNQQVALVGLGGVGKTQIALQFAYWVKEHQPEYSIFWVSGLSDAALWQGYVEMARKLPIKKASNDEDPRESVRRYLSSEPASRWLLIVDGADDKDVLLGSPGAGAHLPKSEHGLTIFTTRTRDVAIAVANTSIVNLVEMAPEEAKDLLQMSLGRNDLASDEAMALVEELEYLPLAITQAATYLCRNQVSVAKYLELLRGSEENFISLMARDYSGNKTVATTWLTSFDKIRDSDPAAADLLSFISYLEPKVIPRSLLPTFESEEQAAHSIGTLCGYGFLTRRGTEEMFDMHGLVHLVARASIRNEAHTAKRVVQRLAEIFPDNDHIHRNMWRQYLPHALRVLHSDLGADLEERYQLCFSVGRCLYVDGRAGEAARWLETCYLWRKSRFLPNHATLLVSQAVLARAYLADRKAQRAVELLEDTVAVLERMPAEEHLFRLEFQSTLAGAYLLNGQVQRGIKLIEYVVAVCQRTLAEENAIRLASQHTLAGAYLYDKQVGMAAKVLEHVVAVNGRTLPEEHPCLLASQHALAIVYYADGQVHNVQKAIELLEHVVACWERTVEKEHPERRASQHLLAHIKGNAGNGMAPTIRGLLPSP